MASSGAKRQQGILADDHTEITPTPLSAQGGPLPGTGRKRRIS
jgi:hypothetical protein